MCEKMRYVAALMTLAFLSAEDIKKREIPLWMLFASGSVALLKFLANGSFSWFELFESCLPGTILYFLAFVTKGEIGSGDGATIVVLGLWTCAGFAFWTLCIGILLAGLGGVFVLLLKKEERELPLIPFFLISMEVLLGYA